MLKKLLIILLILISAYLILSFYFHFSNSNIPYYNKKPLTKLVDLSDMDKKNPNIVRMEKPIKMKRGILKEFPSLVYYRHFEIDLRSYDISRIDLTQYEKELGFAIFDTKTKWPELLPGAFNPDHIMELGKNPGLGIKSLHQRGITGKNVSIAIIEDSTLLTKHNEINENIVFYELLHSQAASSFHGTFVASVAAGKSLGVAPDANIYFIACTPGEIKISGGEVKEVNMDLDYYADAIKRILEINDHLSAEEKIRVISISLGFDFSYNGADKFHMAIEEAKSAGIFVITVSPEHNYSFNLRGLGRNLNGNPDDIYSYGMSLMWKDFIINNDNYDFISGEDILFIPIDSRTIASSIGYDDYIWSSMGGNSHAPPWLAGLYALCIQVYPELTPDMFVEVVMATRETITIRIGIKDYILRGIIQPEAVVNRLLELY